jgi:hypothetical protein
MAVWTAVQQTLIAVIRSGRVWLVQIFGNLLALLLFAAFLHIGESQWYVVAFDFFVLLLAIILLLVLHAGTLRYFLDVEKEGPDLGQTFRGALRHLPAVFVWAAIFVLFRLLITHLEDYHYSLPGYLGSMMPRWMRRVFGEEGLYSSYDAVLAFLRWVVLPGLLLPLCVLCIDRGFVGFFAVRNWVKMLRSLPYWIVLVAASLIGVFCTDKLMGWHMDGSLTGEEFWLGVRLLIALLLAIFSWLWVCAMLGCQRQKLEPRMSASGHE